MVGARTVNAHQRRKTRRAREAVTAIRWWDAPQMGIAEAIMYGIEAAEKRERWINANPLGSKRNPYIVSPAEYRLFKEAGLIDA